MHYITTLLLQNREQTNEMMVITFEVQWGRKFRKLDVTMWIYSIAFE
jgi:hypothetical protein